MDIVEMSISRKPLEMNFVDTHEEVNRNNDIGLNIESTKEDVKEWFQTYKKGKFADLAQFFEGKDWSNIFNLKSKQLLEYLRDDCGIKDTFLIRGLCSVLNLND